MAKRPSIIRTAFCLCTLFAGNAVQAKPEYCKSVVLSGHPNFPPVVWGDHQKIIGAAPDLITEILSNSGITVSSDYLGGNNRVLRKLAAGDIDINPAMIKSPEMEESTHFIDPPIYTQSYAVIVRKGKHTRLDTWEDLIPLQGVTPKGLSFGQEFDAFAKENLKLIRTFNARQGLMMLNVGRVDYAIYPDVQGDLFVSLLDFEGRFEKASVDIASFKLHIGISRKLDCDLPLKTLSEELNYMLSSGQADHTVNDNLYKWMEFSLDRRR